MVLVYFITRFDSFSTSDVKYNLFLLIEINYIRLNHEVDPLPTVGIKKFIKKKRKEIKQIIKQFLY